jgi:hypothetical protein
MQRYVAEYRSSGAFRQSASWKLRQISAEFRAAANDFLPITSPEGGKRGIAAGAFKQCLEIGDVTQS